MRKLTQLCTRGARGVCLIFVCAFAAAQLIMHGRCACVCECAQIMLIIVTQLAAEGREEGGRNEEGRHNLTLMDAFAGRGGRRLFQCSAGTAAAVAGGANSAIFSFLSLFVFPPSPLHHCSLLSVFFISLALYESHFMHAKLVYVRNFKRSVKS